ncbi:MAG: hypothetical protein ACYDEQ_14770 [Desulfocucumaceae bacterium]
MVRKAFLTMLLLALVIPQVACAHAGGWNVVDVRIISDQGGEFTKHRTYPRAAQEGTYFYMEAAKGEKYSIQVANRSDRRIGVVIAVDGRNIISGDKSNLKPGERMYIIDPYATNTFEGWRTGMDKTNRFYFTEQSDSYAEKVFSDGSAMGTIAVAVYREKLPPVALHSVLPQRAKDAPAGAAPKAAREERSSDRLEQEKSEQAGTGFGETTYSPAREVQFEPEHKVAEKIVLKYEWRTELCKKGIITCGSKNRLWPDNGGFAPIPRDFRG